MSRRDADGISSLLWEEGIFPAEAKEELSLYKRRGRLYI
jgi:hypothetical protein